VDVEKSKHVVLEVGGASSESLKFHAGSKDTAQAIVKKVERSMDIATEKTRTAASSPSPITAGRSTPVPPVLPPIQTDIHVGESPRRNEVHFATSPPSVIARSEDADDEDIPPGAVQGHALYDFTAGGDDELTANEGDRLWVLDRSNEDWWMCRNEHGLDGVVPASYVEVSHSFTARLCSSKLLFFS
jgi:hypothetical protein